MTGTVVKHADSDGFERGLRAFFEYRDLGLTAATGGGTGANVIRAIPGEHAVPQWHQHRLDFQFVIVLRGWVRFEYEDIGEVLLQAGTTVLQPPMIKHREIAHSEDLELIEITQPAEFETLLVERA